MRLDFKYANTTIQKPTINRTIRIFWFGVAWFYRTIGNVPNSKQKIATLTMMESRKLITANANEFTDRTQLIIGQNVQHFSQSNFTLDQDIQFDSVASTISQGASSYRALARSLSWLSWCFSHWQSAFFSTIYIGNQMHFDVNRRNINTILFIHLIISAVDVCFFFSTQWRMSTAIYFWSLLSAVRLVLVLRSRCRGGPIFAIHLCRFSFVSLSPSATVSGKKKSRDLIVDRWIENRVQTAGLPLP